MSDSEMSDISEVDMDDFEETPKKKAPAKAAPKKPAAKKTSDEKPAKKKAAPKKKGSDDEMDVDDDDDIVMPIDDEDESPQKPAKPKKNKTVDETYTKMDQREHVLARPDMYVGSTHKIKEPQYVYDAETQGMVLKNLTYAPALYKIFDEILVNAADNFQRDSTMTTIKVVIDKEKNFISVYNDGAGIPVKIHEQHNIWIPEMIFGHLLTGSNFDDEEDKVTGGRNGLGAKLANIYSLEFTVETASSKFKSKFKQTYRDNMLEKGKPRVTENPKGEDWTEISFKPDLKRFEMEELEDDMIELMRRRAWDVAGCNSTLKVFLNGKRLMCKSFTEYVKMYFKHDPTRDVVFERIVDKTGKRRWEVAVTNSDGEPKQVSFVNSIATTRGGTHITHVATKLIAALGPAVKKKNKGAEVKPFQIRNHLWIFVNALINNPEFDSQTKETLKSKQNAFGSKCELTEAFYKKLLKGPVVEQILTWAQNKGMGDLKKVSGKKTSKLTGIAKLDDANQAGGRKAADCTLILTEGDSAKTLAVSGLSVVGRDYYGVFPLKGKLLNVRDATNTAIKKNEEIIALTKIMGLQFSTSYSDVSKLRYGHLMIMADQDHDGSHIKGLVINFIHKFWPSLLKVPGFMLEFITPIVKVTKGKQSVSFFTIPEYEAWKEKNNSTGWKIKYYKGLGTSSAEEAREYFTALQKHRKEFIYKGDNDDDAIDLAFAKNKADNRKDWLRNYQPGTFLDNSMAKIPYNDFINKELILFSMADCQRSIPSLVDGLKPGQRKVLFCCFKRNLKQEIRVAQLSGYVSEKSMYHHGEASLHSTIVGMAQNFVGADNINLLEPVGQFGTRLQGGKDSASARYIHTHLSELARYLYHPDDDKIVSYLEDEGVSIEPEWYIPIMPLVLVNGNEGIGTGWSTKIPNHNPRDVAENIRRLIRKQPVEAMIPWYRGFKGTIEWSDTDKTYIVHGNWSRVDDDTLEVTELPVRTWNLTYKEFLEVCMAGGKEKDKETKDKDKEKEKDDDGEFTKGKKGKAAAEKKKPAVTKRYPEVKGYKDHGTDTTVHFVINAPGLSKMTDDEVEKLFKLRSKLGKSNMHLFDAEGRIKKFDTPEEIIEEFYPLRLKYYAKRKENLVENVQREWKRLENQVRFILMVVKKEIVVANRKKVDLLEELLDKKFDPMPKEKKKKIAGTVKRGNKTTNVEVEADEADEEDGIEEADTNSKNYDYLLSMPIWSLTLERVKKLQEQLNERKKELDELLSTSPEQFWEADLDAFLEKWDDYETKRVAREGTNRKVKKPIAGKAKSKKRKTFDDSDEASDSEDFEVKAPAKAAPKPAAPKPAAPKAAATTVKAEVKAEAPKTTTTVTAKKTDSAADDSKKRKLAQVSLDSFAFSTKSAKKDDDDDKPAAKKQKISTTSSVATKKAVDDDSESESDAPMGLTARMALQRKEEEKAAPKKPAAPAKKIVDSDDSEDDDDLISVKKTAAPVKKAAPAPAAAKKRVVDSDDEDVESIEDSDDDKPAKKAVAKPKAAAAAPAKKAAAPAPAAKKRIVDFDSEDEDDKPAKKSAAARPTRAAPTKKKVIDDDEDDEISSLSEEEDFAGSDEDSDDDVDEEEDD